MICMPMCKFSQVHVNCTGNIALDGFCCLYKKKNLEVPANTLFQSDNSSTNVQSTDKDLPDYIESKNKTVYQCITFTNLSNTDDKIKHLHTENKLNNKESTEERIDYHFSDNQNMKTPENLFLSSDHSKYATDTQETAVKRKSHRTPAISKKVRATINTNNFAIQQSCKTYLNKKTNKDSQCDNYCELMRKKLILFHNITN